MAACSRFLLTLLLSLPLVAQVPAPTGVTRSGVTVRLEPRNGQTTFALGDLIQLDLVFHNAGPTAYTLNITDYGDLADSIDITPSTGWTLWQGPSSHDYAGITELNSTDIRVPLTLNQGYLFQSPGTWQISVTTHRLSQTGSNRSTTALPPLTTDPISITMTALPDAEESARVRSLITTIDTTDASTRKGNAAQRNAIERLASLPGDDALREKVHLILTGDDNMRSFLPEALVSTRNLKLQLALLDAAWRDPQQEPMYELSGALQRTRFLLRNPGQTQPGWQMAMAMPRETEQSRQAARDHAADMQVLLDSLPARTGKNQADAVFYLNDDRSLTPTQLAIVRPLLLQDFDLLDETSQAMVLDSPAAHDPAFITPIHSILDKDPTNQYAITRLIELDPTGVRPYVIRAICNPDAIVPFDAVSTLPATTLPEIDTCLGTLLSTPPGRQDLSKWITRADLAARFATPAILPDIRKGHAGPALDGAFLAVLLRFAPAQAVTALHPTPDPVGTFYETNRVYQALHTPFPDAFLTWLRTQLNATSDANAITGAYELSIAGTPSDRALLEIRLRRLRAQWPAGLSPDPPSENTPAAAAARLETELLSALRNSAIWTVTNDEATQLTRACLTAQCRLYGQPRAANWHP